MTRTDTVSVSPGSPKPLRYAYVKNGDAVGQVRRFAATGKPERSGPNAFIDDFLQARAEDPVLVLCRSKACERFEHGTIRAESFPASGPWLPLRKGWAALRIAIAVLRWKPDRILCGCTRELLWVSTAAARLLGVPIVNSRHNEVIERRGAGRLVMALDRLCIRSCAGVVCHGPFLAEQVRDLGVPAERTRQFEVDLTEFAAAAGGSSESEPFRNFTEGLDTVFAFMGRIQRDKGVFDLLEAFAGLVQGGATRIGLVYVGDGVDSDELRRRVQEQPLADKVLLLGRIPHSQLPGILREVDVVVTPTRPEFPEGRCMVVLEALVLGKPVIAPDYGPFPYAVRHGTSGLLFEAGDRDSLRDNMALTLESATIDRLREGSSAAGRELLTSHLDFSKAVDLTFSAAAVDT